MLHRFSVLPEQFGLIIDFTALSDISNDRKPTFIPQKSLSFSMFTSWDLVCVGICVLSAAIGYLRGFIWDSGTQLSMLFSVGLGYYFVQPVNLYDWRTLMIMLPIFLLVWSLCLVILFRLSGVIHRSPLAPIDRTLGLFGGVTKGLMMLLVGFGVIVASNNQPACLTQSLSYEPLCKSWKALGKMIPPEYQKIFDKHLRLPQPTSRFSSFAG